MITAYKPKSETETIFKAYKKLYKKDVREKIDGLLSTINTLINPLGQTYVNCAGYNQEGGEHGPYLYIEVVHENALTEKEIEKLTAYMQLVTL